MHRAFLLTGFNNWGKTWHIRNLFGGSKFHSKSLYKIQGVNASFAVESRSNDDYNATAYVNAIQKRINHAPNKGENLFSAFCPTRESDNDSKGILKQSVFSSYDEIHLLFLKFKWDHHAELRIDAIKLYLSGIGNLKYYTIDADANETSDISKANARTGQIRSRLQQIFP